MDGIAVEVVGDHLGQAEPVVVAHRVYLLDEVLPLRRGQGALGVAEHVRGGLRRRCGRGLVCLLT